MKLKFHILTLQMRHTFTIAHGSRDDIDAFIVEQNAFKEISQQYKDE